MRAPWWPTGGGLADGLLGAGARRAGNGLVQGRAFIVPDFQIMVVIVSGVFPRSDCTLRPVSS